MHFLNAKNISNKPNTAIQPPFQYFFFVFFACDAQLIFFYAFFSSFFECIPVEWISETDNVNLPFEGCLNIFRHTNFSIVPPATRACEWFMYV